jgi:putative endonuclease
MGLHRYIEEVFCGRFSQICRKAFYFSDGEIGTFSNVEELLMCEVNRVDRIGLGRKAEEAAAGYIQQQGYRLKERNYRCSLGEIDLIAEDGDCLVFIEVRSRKSAVFGLPQETVNWVKQRKLRKLAAYYLKRQNKLERKCRFDVVGILFDEQETVKTLDLIKNAF